ncbi:MAG: diguanylate cyclase [Thermodesulfobacteriota bacterium]
MDNILLVEDSKSLALLLKNSLEATLPCTVHWADGLAKTKALVANPELTFSVGILDINLPDAPRGEVVDFVLSRGIPSIVFAGEFSTDLQKSLWSRTIIDYVLKEDPNNIGYLVGLVRRVMANRNIKVLVADDSKASRLELTNLLTIHQYQVFAAADGQEALDLLGEHPDIRLLLTDHYMPRVNGLELVKRIRHSHPKDELAIVALSATDASTLPAQFIKGGANDFLKKPYTTEEFYCRITQNIELLEQIARIKEHAHLDFLTNLHNRRYFFDLGRKLVASARRGHIELTLALFDIDHFKRINDTFGHDTGDLVLKNLAHFLRKRFRETDIVCRYGGEEFCILATNMSRDHAATLFDDLRRRIAATPVVIGEREITFTVSIGVCAAPKGSLEEMIQQADVLLYQAKQNGRNRIALR